MDLTGWLRTKILLYLAVILIAFGVFNLSTSLLATAQQAEVGTALSTDRVIFEQVLAQIVPIVGGAIAIAVQFARKQGLRISAEAEEYFVNTAKSFVVNQSRFLYKEIRDNPQYREAFAQGRIPRELGEKAKTRVLEQLRVELRSDEFTKTARNMLNDNLEALIEKHVTENKRELAEKARRLLNDLAPVAVDASLLSFNTQEEAKKNKDKIIRETLESIRKTLDFEELLLPDDDAIMRIKSELNKRIGKVK